MYPGTNGDNGGGACNNDGADNFNGATTNRITCVLQWFKDQVLADSVIGGACMHCCKYADPLVLLGRPVDVVRPG